MRTTHSDLAQIVLDHVAKLEAARSTAPADIVDASTRRCLSDAAQALVMQDRRLEFQTVVLRACRDALPRESPVWHRVVECLGMK